MNYNRRTSKKISFYIAGSFSQKEKIRKYIDRIKELGGIITSDWTLHPAIFPYGDNLERAKEFAEEDLEGARGCRCFVLFPEKDGGSTQFAELGAAIFSKKVERVFVVGENNERSLSFFHPRVERVAYFREILVRLGLV